MSIEVIDNFLDPVVFKRIQSKLMGEDFPWWFSKNIVFRDQDDGGFQFIHDFYRDYSDYIYFSTSDREVIPDVRLLVPVLKALNCEILVRVKANLLTRTAENVMSAFHIDIPGVKDLESLSTSILYVNSNDGVTKFKDGTTVESVANRVVIFPAATFHAGTSCTDQKTRVVINFNFFRADSSYLTT